MAFHLHNSSQSTLAFGSHTSLETRRMRKDFQFRVSALVLAVITLGAVVFATINYWKESQFPVPYDGVWWVESGNGLRAERLTPDGPAERAGIKPGDQLLAIDDSPITAVQDSHHRVVRN